ncbi:MAG: S-formylglutathione hydrolase [Pseudomonadota bacterium]
MSELTVVSQQRCFGGTQGFYSHPSALCGGEMKFAVFQPPQALSGAKVPLLIYLSGLTCTEENFVVKAGAQSLAAELGMMILAPDTSPRGSDYPGEHDAYDFGSAAGFYLDATQEPWSKTYKMYSYITQELPAVIAAHFPADMDRQGITGHSMGGHGALTIHLKNPQTYKTASAFAPICAPTQCPWGEKALGGYLGPNKETWRAYDTCELLKDGNRSEATLLVDQGDADGFLGEQLKPELLSAACEAAGQSLELRMQPDYDHSYYFIATFMDDHLRHHAAGLGL